MNIPRSDLKLNVWHGFEWLAKRRTAKVVHNDLIRDIYEALERNGDLTSTWRNDKRDDCSQIVDSGATL